ncbi:MAG: 2Fe-2S iron-sulfur cluster-binding protein, partial [Synechococcaceae cyanobacterium]
MTRTYPITVHWRQAGRVIRHQVPEGEYILRSFERQGDPLPFSCRNGCCTACAVRVADMTAFFNAEAVDGGTGKLGYLVEYSETE